MDAINVTMSPKQDLIQSVTTAMTEEVIRLPNSGMTIGEIQQRLEDLSTEFAAVLALTKENGTEPYMARFREIAEETKALKAQQEQIAGQLRMNTVAQEKLHIVQSALETANHRLTRWDEEMIRQTGAYGESGLQRLHPDLLDRWSGNRTEGCSEVNLRLNRT